MESDAIPVETLKILLVSDIHLAYENVEKMIKWQKEHNAGVRYDFVLGSGDFGNINHKVMPEDILASNSKEMLLKRYETREIEERSNEEKAEKDIARVLEIIEKGLPGHPPIYYIPGNHDTKAMILDNDIRPTLTLNSVNLHNQWVELRKDLALVALGGSCPSYFRKHGEIEMTSIYQAYPYLKDSWFKEDLDKLLSQVDSKQILLMTHDGPQSSSTTQDKTTKIDEGDILFGSSHLFQLLKNDGGKKIFANIHGHAHDGSPCDKITDGVRIINPGSLKYGEYAELVLVRSRQSGMWHVSQFVKHYLRND